MLQKFQNPNCQVAMLDVLYEDNHLLAVNKPAMLPTMGVAEDRPSLLGGGQGVHPPQVRQAGRSVSGHRQPARCAGDRRRADRADVEGGRAAHELFRERDVEKTYWALVEGRVEPASGALVALSAQGRTASADARHAARTRPMPSGPS